MKNFVRAPEARLDASAREGEFKEKKPLFLQIKTLVTNIKP